MFQKLLDMLGEVYDLSRTATLLGWDELCMMPRGGSAARADQKATLERLIHQRFTSDEMGEVLDALADWANACGFDTFEGSLVRVTRRNYEQYKKIPPELVVAMSRAASRGYHSWAEARRANDFRVWQPMLEEVVRLLIELTEVMGYTERRYDALLERREPGLRTIHVEALFDRIRAEIVPFARLVAEHSDTIDDRVLHQHFDPERQRTLAGEVVRTLGFDFDRGRIDTALHPISYSISPGDVRLATRIKEHSFPAGFFSTIHEAGHGMYFQGVPMEFRRTSLDGTTAQGANLTPVYGGISTGLHESQARMWENVLGRSRPFWGYWYPRVQSLFPEQTEGVSLEAWYRAVNRSRPSLIRVEADEVTYDLHIMLRFDLENMLIEQELAVADLPTAWADLSERYLGLRPSDDLTGVLQDIQWSRGGHGGFPSYTIGNTLGLQLWRLMEAATPDLETQLREGNFLVVRDWMGRNIHCHGSKYQPLEIVERLTGQAALDPGPYIAYLKQKFGELYGISPGTA
ncbi:MAG TPA: carboxypeptidase M32 [Chloroflexaceae bacterium]|nr:carboxypeptidase M32 [Chloroflexaceae bacterium]